MGEPVQRPLVLFSRSGEYSIVKEHVPKQSPAGKRNRHKGCGRFQPRSSQNLLRLAFSSPRVTREIVHLDSSGCVGAFQNAHCISAASSPVCSLCRRGSHLPSGICWKSASSASRRPFL